MGEPEHVVNFMRMIAEKFRELMPNSGSRQMNRMIGRVDRLEVKKAIDHWKAKGLDFTSILAQPKCLPASDVSARFRRTTAWKKPWTTPVLLKLCEGAIERKEKVVAALPIRNVNRVVAQLLAAKLHAAGR